MSQPIRKFHIKMAKPRALSVLVLASEIGSTINVVPVSASGRKRTAAIDL